MKDQQKAILLQLKEVDKIKQKELGEILNVKPNTLTNQLKPLIESGLVEKIRDREGLENFNWISIINKDLIDWENFEFQNSEIEIQKKKKSKKSISKTKTIENDFDSDISDVLEKQLQNDKLEELKDSLELEKDLNKKMEQKLESFRQENIELMNKLRDMEYRYETLMKKSTSKSYEVHSFPFWEILLNKYASDSELIERIYKRVILGSKDRGFLKDWLEFERFMKEKGEI